jgi:hypothetical protein
MKRWFEIGLSDVSQALITLPPIAAKHAQRNPRTVRLPGPCSRTVRRSRYGADWRSHDGATLNERMLDGNKISDTSMINEVHLVLA